MGGVAKNAGRGHRITEMPLFELFVSGLVAGPAESIRLLFEQLFLIADMRQMTGAAARSERLMDHGAGKG